MADIPSLLLASLDPHNRKKAEQSLQTYSVQPAFTTNLLQLVLASSQNRAVRLAGSVYIKNLVKGRWFDDDENTVSDADKAALKAQLLPAMLALSAQSDRGLRAQIAETVTIVAKYDFPHAWPDLMDIHLMIVPGP